MIIKKVAVGNQAEAYIESDFSGGFNIISSDDNNKGKTIIIQSMMYALGNEPAFPSSFNYQDYFYYVEFEVDGKLHRICRRGNIFTIKAGSSIMILENVSELKRYWSKRIFKYPVIMKNQMSKIVDPVLFFQLFFVGQDKRDTSSIAHSGLYNKQDFLEMLYSIMGYGLPQLSEEEIDNIKSRIAELTEEKKVLLKQHKILKSKKTAVSFLSSANDCLSFGIKLDKVEKIKNRLSELRKARNMAVTRRARWETAIKELRSLNRTIDCGELRCMDCGSEHISFSMERGTQRSYAFDVSTPEMRSDIISAIQEKIDSYVEEVERLTSEIAELQARLQDILDDESITLESIVAYKEDVFSASDAEKRISEIENDLSRLKDQLQQNNASAQTTQEQRTSFLSGIINEMNKLRSYIDPSSNTEYNGLFTRSGEIVSGSETTVFYFSRLIALHQIIGHNYPIIMDSFRSEDLSTEKERILIDLCSSIANQIIFTTTLKQEEEGKYDNIAFVHHIDYTSHAPNKILSPDYVEDFLPLLSELAITTLTQNSEGGEADT